jgi:hypothetical protein
VGTVCIEKQQRRYLDSETSPNTPSRHENESRPLARNSISPLDRPACSSYLFVRIDSHIFIYRYHIANMSTGMTFNDFCRVIHAIAKDAWNNPLDNDHQAVRDALIPKYTAKELDQEATFLNKSDDIEAIFGDEGPPSWSIG